MTAAKDIGKFLLGLLATAILLYPLTAMMLLYLAGKLGFIG